MRKHYQLYIMIIPTIVLFFLLIYLPMFGVVIAFRKYDIVGGIFGTNWVGFKYFVQFFKDPYFFRIIRNTVVLNGYSLAFGFPAPIILALMVNEVKNMRFKRITQSITYLPHFVSVVIIVGIMMEIFASRGVANQVLVTFGIEKQLFFNDVKWFRFLYVSSGIWQSVGWSSIIYLAALAGINVELYENSSLEGANRFQKIIYITIPGILPTIMILFILSVGNIMSVGFEKVFLMYNPGTYEVADVITTYVYRRGILGLDYSYATAVGLFNSAVNLLFLASANYMSRRATENSLW